MYSVPDELYSLVVETLVIAEKFDWNWGKIINHSLLHLATHMQYHCFNSEVSCM